MRFLIYPLLFIAFSAGASNENRIDILSVPGAIPLNLLQDYYDERGVTAFLHLKKNKNEINNLILNSISGQYDIAVVDLEGSDAYQKYKISYMKEEASAVIFMGSWGVVYDSLDFMKPRKWSDFYKHCFRKDNQLFIPNNGHIIYTTASKSLSLEESNDNLPDISKNIFNKCGFHVFDYDTDFNKNKVSMAIMRDKDFNSLYDEKSNMKFSNLEGDIIPSFLKVILLKKTKKYTESLYFIEFLNKRIGEKNSVFDELESLYSKKYSDVLYEVKKESL